MTSAHSGFGYFVQAVCIVKAVFCTTQIHGKDTCVSASASRKLFKLYAMIVKLLRHKLLCVQHT